MEEKREIKVRLSTVVYLFIILVLVVALGVVYYLGFVANKEGDTNITTENVLTNNSTESKYIELTKELNSKDVLYVTRVEKNSDNTYTLYGVVFNCNENVNPDYQISDTWTVTKDYKKVTVSSDTKCISGYPEEEETTVGKYFNNYGEIELQKVVENTTLIDEYTYSFRFENGNCVKVIDYCTSV